jgi:hypothetical protein
MIKKLTALFIFSTNILNAQEIKVNLPIGTLPMNEKDNGENWNKYNFGEAGGLSYLTTPDYWGNQFGVTMIYYDKNIFGNNSAIATLDYQNTVYKYDKFDIKLGLRGGIATGYNSTTTSGNIPILGATGEVQFDNVSLQTMITPSYKNIPTAISAEVRFTAVKW